MNTHTYEHVMSHIQIPQTPLELTAGQASKRLAHAADHELFDKILKRLDDAAQHANFSTVAAAIEAHTGTGTYVYTHTYVHICMYVYTCMYIHMYACIQFLCRCCCN